MTKILNETLTLSGKEFVVLAVLPCISLLTSGKSAAILSIFLCIFLLLSFFVLFLRQFFFSGNILLSIYFSFLIFISSFLYMIFPVYLHGFFIEKNHVFLPFFSVIMPFFMGNFAFLTKTHFWIQSLKIIIVIVFICCSLGFLREVLGEGKIFGFSLSVFGLEIHRGNNPLFFGLSIGGFFLLILIYWCMQIRARHKKTGKNFYVW